MEEVVGFEPTELTPNSFQDCRNKPNSAILPNMARRLGLEPKLMVLETTVLPITPSPYIWWNEKVSHPHPQVLQTRAQTA